MGKLNLIIVIFATIFLLGVASVFAQEKRVKVVRIEVDGQEVKTKFKVDIISGEKKGKVYNAKIDGSSFIVPAEVVGKNVGVIFRFKNYAATFFFVSPPNFDNDWTVGVDTKPFAEENVASSDPPDTAIIYYVKLGTETKAALKTAVGTPKVTINRLY